MFERKEELARLCGVPASALFAVEAYERGEITLSRLAELMLLGRGEVARFLEEAGVEVRVIVGEDVAAESGLA